jgi:hypothetical protein
MLVEPAISAATVAKVWEVLNQVQAATHLGCCKGVKIFFFQLPMQAEHPILN